MELSYGDVSLHYRCLFPRERHSPRSPEERRMPCFVLSVLMQFGQLVVAYRNSEAKATKHQHSVEFAITVRLSRRSRFFWSFFCCCRCTSCSLRGPLTGTLFSHSSAYGSVSYKRNILSRAGWTFCVFHSRFTWLAFKAWLAHLSYFIRALKHAPACRTGFLACGPGAG